MKIKPIYHGCVCVPIFVLNQKAAISSSSYASDGWKLPVTQIYKLHVMPKGRYITFSTGK